MRYAIISDVHGNRQALAAVLNDIRHIGVDQILCLGDMVGYGPAPAEVLEKLYVNVHFFVLGNHEAVLCGKLPADCFNDDARRIIDWTGKQLNRKAVPFFANLPLVLKGPEFRCTHAEFEDPTRFGYILEDAEAAASWATCPEPLLFVGHTHCPSLFVIGASQIPHRLEANDFGLEEGKRYLINVGSVGQPRDGDSRACYCLYDQDQRSVYFHRVPFDVDAYREELQRTGLPMGPSRFLQVAAGRQPPPLREALDFHPAAPAPAGSPPAVYKVTDLEKARRSARRWRLTGLLALALFFFAASGGGWLYWRYRPTAVTWPALTGITLDAAKVPAGTELLVRPEVIGRVSLDTRLAHWGVDLQAPARQQVDVEQDDTAAAGEAEIDPAPRFRLNSERLLNLTLLSAGISAESGQRFAASGQFKLQNLQEGYVELALILETSDGTRRVLEQKQARNNSRERWETVRFTLAKSGGALRQPGLVRLRVGGQFRGAVLVRKCSLVRCE